MPSEPNVAGTIVRLASGECVSAARQGDGSVVTTPYKPISGGPVSPVTLTGLAAPAALTALGAKLNEVITRLNTVIG